MPTFCTTGQTARVTFPDATVRDFTGSPVTIDVTRTLEGFTPCQMSGIIYAKTVGSPNNFQQISSRIFLPVLDIFVRVFPTAYNQIVVSHTLNNNCSATPRETVTAGGSGNGSSAIVLDWFFKANSGTNYFPTYKIKVTDSSGTLLFTGSYSTNTYSVTCIAVCPPNTLDCGDCCLDCGDIFNDLSDIRKTLSELN